MNYLKRSLMAIAGACLLSVNANAYTFPADKTYHHPDVPEYTVTFRGSLRGISTMTPENDNTSSVCEFCWFDTCYSYIYIYDNKRTVYIDKVGMYIMIGDNLYEVPFTKRFEK